MLTQLLAQAKLGAYLTIALYVGLLQIILKAAAPTDHLQQATAGMVVVLVFLEVLVQVVDGLVLPAPGRYITEAEGRRLVCGVLPGGSIEPEEPFGEPKKLRFIDRIG